ncbi:glycoside hydrolase family 3 C-terminal domain-containing protein [Actinomyces sp. oral taxon 414]|nr:glycoside hydrolase family 3 C-terminal domain-containing protein [Actinomyces sp. oral taxon 414]
MGDRPVVVVVRMHNPAVLTELEPLADAVVVDFGVSQEAVWDLVRGAFEPSGLLPVRLPASMEAVERHCEDLPFDYEPYTDSAGHRYDFGYGLSWAGVIEDERTRRYTAPGGA